MTKLPVFKSIDEIKEFMEQHNITVEEPHHEDYSHNEGDIIFISRSASGNEKTFMLVSELASIFGAKGEGNVPDVVEELELVAIDALSGMARNPNDPFLFDDFMNAYVFNKLRAPLRKKGLLFGEQRDERIELNNLLRLLKSKSKRIKIQWLWNRVPKGNSGGVGWSTNHRLTRFTRKLNETLDNGWCWATNNEKSTRDKQTNSLGYSHTVKVFIKYVDDGVMYKFNILTLDQNVKKIDFDGVIKKLKDTVK